jgi:opacity protein-like surface antigen
LLVGASAKLELFPSFTFAAGVQYTQKGTEFVIGLPGGIQTRTDFKRTYLEVPVTLTLDLAGNAPRVYLLGGTTVGTLLSAAAESSQGEIQYRDSLNRSDMAVEFGGGIEIPLSSHVSINTEGRYSFGLDDVGKKGGSILSTDAWRSRDLRVVLGLYYSIFARDD